MPLLLLVFSSDLFYQVFSAPLKLITPVSEKKKAEAIIVASAGVHPSGAPTHSSAIRAHTAGLLYLENWAPEIIVAGGVMEPYDPPLEIKGIRLILRGMGIPDEAILVETKSKNTHENGFAVSEILAEKNKSIRCWVFTFSLVEKVLKTTENRLSSKRAFDSATQN